MANLSATFSGSIPEHYDRCLGPAYFGPFAADLAQRLPARPAGAVLELACGTGLLTRHLRERLGPAVRLVASDLSKAMLDYARGKVDELGGIEWREADVVNLPFADGEFGAVVCGFGFMFAPDRKAALGEARRVLADDGILLFNVWDRIEENPHSEAVAQVIESRFPGDPELRFRVPHEMCEPALLRQLLAEAKFREVQIVTKRIPLDQVSARTLATGQILGTPRSLLIEKRGVRLDEIVDQVTARHAQFGGADPYRGSAQALIVEARAAQAIG